MSRYNLADVEKFCSAFYPGKKLSLVPYAYATVFTALAQNQTASNVVNIAANADFFAFGLRHRAQTGAAQTVSTITAPFVRLLITDSGSNEQFTSQAVDLMNYSTTGDGIRDFPYPRLVQGRSSLTFAVQNYAPIAETYTTLEIMIEGVLVRAYNA